MAEEFENGESLAAVRQKLNQNARQIDAQNRGKASLKSGVAVIGIAPDADVNHVDINTPGTYPLYGGLVVTTEDLDGNLVKFKRFDNIWQKEVIGKGFASKDQLKKSEAKASFQGYFSTVEAANASIPDVINPLTGKNHRDGKTVNIGTEGSYTIFAWFGGFSDDKLRPLIDPSFLKSETVATTFGIQDPNGYVLQATTENGDSYPPPKEKSIYKSQLHPEILSGMLQDINTISFAVQDANGYIVSAITLSGDQYPPAGTNSVSSGGATPAPTPITAPITDIAADYIEPGNIQLNGVWNQWIEPIAVVWGDDLFFCSIGDGYRRDTGELWLSKKNKSSSVITKKIGRIRGTAPFTDDHNCPAILTDTRPGAPYPLMIFQAEHNSHLLRVLKLDSKDNPDSWTGKSFSNVGTEKLGYVSVFRNGDEIIVFSRLAGQPRPWLLSYSVDNGVTWAQKPIFQKTGDSWMYIMAKERPDKSGINFVFGSHPLNSSDTRLCIMSLDWATGAIKAPSGAVAIPNFRAAMADSNFTPIDPFLFGDPILAQQNGALRRFWDMKVDSNGFAQLLYTIAPTRQLTMANFNLNKFRLIKFSWNSGAVSVDFALEDAGMPIERPLESNYVAGGTILSPSKVALFIYKNQSQLDGGNDTSGNDGKTVGLVVDVTNPLALTKKQFSLSKNKVIRPYVAGDYLLYCECEKFIEYTDFKSNILIDNISQINQL